MSSKENDPVEEGSFSALFFAKVVQRIITEHRAIRHGFLPKPTESAQDENSNKGFVPGGKDFGCFAFRKPQGVVVEIFPRGGSSAVSQEVFIPSEVLPGLVESLERWPRNHLSQWKKSSTRRRLYLRKAAFFIPLLTRLTKYDTFIC